MPRTPITSQRNTNFDVDVNSPLFQEMAHELSQRDGFEWHCSQFDNNDLSQEQRDKSTAYIYNNSQALIIAGYAGVNTVTFFKEKVTEMKDSPTASKIKEGLRKCERRLQTKSKTRSAIEEGQKKDPTISEQIEATQKEITGLKEFDFDDNSPEVKEAQARLVKLTSQQNAAQKNLQGSTGVDIAKLAGIIIPTPSNSWVSKSVIGNQSQSRAD